MNIGCSGQFLESYVVPGFLPVKRFGPRPVEQKVLSSTADTRSKTANRVNSDPIGGCNVRLERDSEGDRRFRKRLRGCSERDSNNRRPVFDGHVAIWESVPARNF